MVLTARLVVSAAAHLAACAHASECAGGEISLEECSLLQQPPVQQIGLAGALSLDLLAQASASLDTRSDDGGAKSSIESALAKPWREGCQEVVPMLAQASANDLARVCAAAQLPEEACAEAISSGPLRSQKKPWTGAQLAKACSSLEAERHQGPCDDQVVESALIARAMRGNPLDAVGDGISDGASDVASDFDEQAHGAQGVNRMGAGVRNDAQDLEQSLSSKYQNVVAGENDIPAGRVAAGQPFATGLSNPPDEVLGYEQPELNATELEAALAEDSAWEDANWTANWTENASQGFYLPGGYAEPSNYFSEDNTTEGDAVPGEPVAEEPSAAEENHGPQSWELGGDSDAGLNNSSIDFGDAGPNLGDDLDRDDSAETPADDAAANDAAADGEEAAVDDTVDDNSTDTVDNNSTDSSEEPASEEPAADEPADEELAAEEFAAEDPSAEEPVAEESASEEPAEEEPTPEGADSEDSGVEEPAAEEPAPEESVAEESAVEEEVPGDSHVLPPPN